LEFAGIPNDVEDENLEDEVISILSQIQIYIDKDEIEACHRLPPTRSCPNNKKVITRFVNRKIVEKTMKAKKYFSKLRTSSDTKVYINENLNKHFQKMAWRCRTLKKERMLDSFKYQNEAFILYFAENNKPIKVTSEKQILDLFPGYYSVFNV